MLQVDTVGERTSCKCSSSKHHHVCHRSTEANSRLLLFGGPRKREFPEAHMGFVAGAQTVLVNGHLHVLESRRLFALILPLTWHKIWGLFSGAQGTHQGCLQNLRSV